MIENRISNVSSTELEYSTVDAKYVFLDSVGY